MADTETAELYDRERRKPLLVTRVGRLSISQNRVPGEETWGLLRLWQ